MCYIVTYERKEYIRSIGDDAVDVVGMFEIVNNAVYSNIDDARKAMREFYDSWCDNFTIVPEFSSENAILANTTDEMEDGIIDSYHVHLRVVQLNNA